MSAPESLSIRLFEGSCLFRPELRARDFIFFLCKSGNFVPLGPPVMAGRSAPPAMAASGSPSFCVRGDGSLWVMTASAPLIDNLLNTSYGGRISRIIRTVRDGQWQFYRPSLQETAHLEEIILRIKDEVDRREPEWEEVVQLHLLELFMGLRRLAPLAVPAGSGAAEGRSVRSVADIARYLEDHYDDSFTLDQLASRCALNASYFSRAFKEHAGVPLFEYINRLRIDRACSLLRDTDRTVLDIALTVGYNNVSFFNRYFRRLTGLSPGAYRKKVRA